MSRNLHSSLKLIVCGELAGYLVYSTYPDVAYDTVDAHGGRDPVAIANLYRLQPSLRVAAKVLQD